MPSGKDDAMKKMQRELDAIIEKNRKAFEGDYGDALHNLLGLSEDQLAELIPATEGREVYAQLIDVVKDASAKNLAIAQLRQRIEVLGDTAIAIAKKAGILT